MFGEEMLNWASTPKHTTLRPCNAIYFVEYTCENKTFAFVIVPLFHIQMHFISHSLQLELRFLYLELIVNH